MCNQVIEEIKQYQPLLERNRLRYDGRFHTELHPDNNLHILLFDIIYCCTTYDLFDGMIFSKTNRSANNNDRKIRQMRALQAKADVEKYQMQLSEISEIKKALYREFAENTTVVHKTYGNAYIKEIDSKRGLLTIITENNEERKVGIVISCLNGLLPVNSDVKTMLESKSDIITNEKIIENKYKQANSQLELYSDQL